METIQSPEKLRGVIELTHGCRAAFREAVEVTEKFGGATVWEGTVLVFSVDHPDANTCYAWWSPIEGGQGHRIYVILGKPPIDSPGAAVRASIVSDYRESQR